MKIPLTVSDCSHLSRFEVRSRALHLLCSLRHDNDLDAFLVLLQLVALDFHVKDGSGTCSAKAMSGARASNLLVLSRDFVRAVAVAHGGAWGVAKTNRRVVEGLVFECGSCKMQCSSDARR